MLLLIVHLGPNLPLNDPAAGKDKNTPLHTCIKYLDHAVTNGGEINVAATHHLIKCAVALLKMKADLDLKNADTRTPLMQAARVSGPLGEASTAMLLAFKPKVDIVDGRGMSALHHAVEAGQGPAVKLLLAAGIRLQLPSSDGLTPLQLAARAGFVDIAQLLVEKGARVNFYPDAMPQEVALEKAAESLGLDDSLHDLPRMPPLMHAIVHNKAGMVEALLGLGADPIHAGWLGE